MSAVRTRGWAIAGSAGFLVLAPGFVAGFVPWWISRWRFGAAWSEEIGFQVAGAVLITVGVAGLLDSFARFALEGLGTPAPGFGTRQLVIAGPYRFLRNPMYVSVLSIILGQALVLGNVELLAYGGLVWLLFHAFVLLYEEPTLRAKFGPDYDVYCGQVPRWIPGSKRRQQTKPRAS